jgi:hypothetical protein
VADLEKKRAIWERRVSLKEGGSGPPRESSDRTAEKTWSECWRDHECHGGCLLCLTRVLGGSLNVFMDILVIDVQLEEVWSGR